jgi:hypothetical protein
MNRALTGVRRFGRFSRKLPRHPSSSGSSFAALAV